MAISRRCLAVSALMVGMLTQACVKKQLAGPAMRVAPAGLSRETGVTQTETLHYPQAEPLDEDKAVQITADHLRYDEASSQTHFTGNVRVHQDTSNLYADELITRNRKETGRAQGHVRLVDERRQLQMTADQVDYVNKLSMASVTGGLHLVSTDPYGRAVSVTANTGTVWPSAGLASLKGKVKVMRGSLTATAKTAEVDEEKGVLLLKGGVRMKQDKNQFRAQEATLKEKGNILILQGDVRAQFIPAELKKASASPGALP